MSAMRDFCPFCLATLFAALALATVAPPLAAIEITESGYFIFDIDSPADMRAVGERSGIQTKDDAPLALGQQECRRWADQFHVRPYRAVVSGTLAGRPGRVWICSGKADSPLLSELYCRQLGMAYVKHERSRVTCRLRDRS